MLTWEDGITVIFGDRVKNVMDRDRPHGWRPLVSHSNPSPRYFGKHMPYLGMQGLAERQMHSNFPADLVQFKETRSANRKFSVTSPPPKTSGWPLLFRELNKQHCDVCFSWGKPPWRLVHKNSGSLLGRSD